jgi:hypothetical protein
MEQWVGRDSNPEPTPKAFWAVLIAPISQSNSVHKSQVVDSFCA